MKFCKLCLTILLFLAGTAGYATTHIVTNDGFVFVPASLTVQAGDTIVFSLENDHNVAEVTKGAWDANDDTSNGGFLLPFGGDTLILTVPNTYYYVCQPHAAMGMKGIIIVEPASQADEVYVAELSGSQEVLPVVSTGRGEIRAELTGDQLVVTGSFRNLGSDFNPNVAGGSHLHRGYAGQNGGIELGLTVTLDGDSRGGSYEAAQNTFTLSESQLALLRNRQLYVNIHTTGFPSGEIRGQLVPEADKVYYTNLFGSNEAPSVMSDGHGALVLELRDDSLFVSGSFADLNGQYDASIAGGSHLHQGQAGENGGILFGLTPTLGAELRSGVYNASANRFALNSAQRDLLERRALYANIHTTRNAGGEIRGQIHEAATTVFRAFLAGSNEAPPALTGAGGQLLLEVDGDDLTVSGTFRGLESDFNSAIAGGAHLHLGLAGSNGSVVFRLTATVNTDNRSGRFLPADNSFSPDNAQLGNFYARQYYANIHTTTFTGGEIRGQVVPESQFVFQSFLSGTQEVTPVLSDGFGALVAEVMGNRLTVSGSFAGLSSPVNTAIAGGGHLHYGLAGANGPVGRRLMLTLDTDQLGGDVLAADNTFTLRSGERDTLKARMFYANVHSMNFPGGEVRGQLLPEANLYFFAPLSGAGEAPAVNSPGLGALALEWNGSALVASGAFSGLGSDFNANIAGGAHLHVGYAGRNGGIRFGLASEVNTNNRSGRFMAASNVFTPSAAFADTLRARLLYANIHTQQFAGGEIRGQVLPAATSYFTTFASGLTEVQPVNSTGRGALKLELTGDKLVVSGGFSDLASDFNPNVGGGSHLHVGAPGANGSVAVPLNALLTTDNRGGVYPAATNTFTLNPTQLANLKNGNLYFNVHTLQVVSGEIRGQVLPESNFFPDTSMITAPAGGSTVLIEGPADTPFQPTWSTAADPDGDAVAYIWQLAATPAFALPLVTVSTAADTFFTATYGTIATLLTAAGITPGQSIKLYHRALATDGSLVTRGPVDSVSLTLGVVTGFDEVIAGKFQVRLFPVPADQWLQLEVTASENARAQLQLFDLSGRLRQRQPLLLGMGATTHRLDVSSLPPGAYFLQLLVDGQPLRALPFAVQR